MLSITPNTGPGVVQNCAPVPAVNGVAKLGKCTISEAGSRYRLTATVLNNPAIPGAVTYNIVDKHRIAVHPNRLHLVFTTEPGGAKAGRVSALNPSFQSRPTTATSVAKRADLITLSISAGKGVLKTCASVHAVHGVATFVGCSISKVGKGYVLRATDAADSVIPPVTSAPFNVSKK